MIVQAVICSNVIFDDAGLFSLPENSCVGETTQWVLTQEQVGKVKKS